MATSNLFHKSPQSIQRNIKSIPGSFQRILFAPIEEILWTQHVHGYFAVNPTTGVLDHEQIDVIAGSSGFREAIFVNARKGYKEEQQASDAGSNMVTTVNAVIPFQTDQQTLNIDSAILHKYVVLVEFCGKHWRILGNKNDGASLSHIEDSGETRKAVPGIALTFSWASVSKPLLYVMP